MRVHEMRPPAATFGFAVGLTGGMLSALLDTDPALHHAISRAAHAFSSSGFRLPQFTRWVLGQPVRSTRHRYPSRLRDSAGDTAILEIRSGDAWGPEADGLVDRALASVRQGADVIRLTGANSQGALLDRLAFGERLRSDLPALVEVTSGTRYPRHAVDGLVAGRTDLVHVPDAS
ncbi:hypothetical protein [Streptomyces sp. T028]|uniref:hypothetical protein n=1 Tax=Streptomyces sp. T028 TaxID=3394379 RepID=UPI003A890660